MLQLLAMKKMETSLLLIEVSASFLARLVLQAKWIVDSSFDSHLHNWKYFIFPSTIHKCSRGVPDEDNWCSNGFIPLAKCNSWRVFPPRIRKANCTLAKGAWWSVLIGRSFMRRRNSLPANCLDRKAIWKCPSEMKDRRDATVRLRQIILIENADVEILGRIDSHICGTIISPTRSMANYASYLNVMPIGRINDFFRTNYWFYQNNKILLPLTGCQQLIAIVR